MSSKISKAARRRALELAVRLVGSEADRAMHVGRASRDVVEASEDCEETLKAMLAEAKGSPMSDDLRKALELLTPPCALGCTGVQCPQPGEAPRSHDSLCCIALRALASTPASLPPNPVTVERIECVPISHPFPDKDGRTDADPVWRIVIDGYCADFDYEQAANNFAAAINRRIASSPTVTEEMAERAVDEAMAIAAEEGAAMPPSGNWRDEPEADKVRDFANRILTAALAPEEGRTR